MSTMKKKMRMKEELIGRMAMKMMKMETMNMKRIMIRSSMPPARTQILTITRTRISQTHISTLCLTITITTTIKL